MKLFSLFAVCALVGVSHQAAAMNLSSHTVVKQLQAAKRASCLQAQKKSSDLKSSNKKRAEAAKKAASDCKKLKAQLAAARKQNASNKVCAMIYAPVCANGETFPNSCVAREAGFSSYDAGACGTKATVICTADFAPVCGADGFTYSNPCEADKAGVTIAHDGACSQ